jgi:polar amino acid transport system substrate-binding protein
MIRLAYDDPFPPFAFTEDGKAKGVVIDILAGAFRRAGIEAAFVPSPMEKIQCLLDAGEVDGIAFYGVTPERSKVFDFSDPFFVTGAALFTRSPEPPASNLKDYENKSVVTPKTGPLAEYIQREAPGVKLILVRDYLEALRSVLDGKACAAALNYHVGRDLADRLFPGCFTPPKKIFLEMPLAVAMVKGKNRPLVRRINEALAVFKYSAPHKGIVPE